MYLSSEKKMLYCQLFSTHYVAVQINRLKGAFFAIKVATLKITDDFRYKWKLSRAYNKIDIFHGEQR